MVNKVSVYVSLFVVAIISGCASGEYNQGVANKIMIAAAERASNPITSTHMRCFRCENDRWPSAVSELKVYSPSTKECKLAYEASNLTEVDYIQNAAISVKELDDKVLFLFSKKGVNHENMTFNDTFVSKNFMKSEVSCSHNKTLKRTP